MSSLKGLGLRLAPTPDFRALVHPHPLPAVRQAERLYDCILTAYFMSRALESLMTEEAKTAHEGDFFVCV